MSEEKTIYYKKGKVRQMVWFHKENFAGQNQYICTFTLRELNKFLKDFGIKKQDKKHGEKE